jgi:glycerol-3-phosphate acyltransferase PlsX
VSKPLTIALDAMGGDRGPDMVIPGANIARIRYPGVKFLLFGDERQLAPLLQRFSDLAGVSEIHHTEKIIAAEDRPSQALRQGRQSSMWLAIEAVQRGDADAVVSAGNTGALMAMAKFLLRTLPGIDRPAMVSFFPTIRGESCMLDLGANVECDSNNLVEFAVMGAAFARIVLGLARPLVGLLNIGVEELKGNDTVKAAGQMLQEANLAMEYYGFVEGDDITAGTVDVIVADGFTGNIAIKTAEGTANLLTEFLARSFRRSVFSRLGYLLARPALRAFRERIDPRAYNGAMFMGLNGIAVKSHGGTDPTGFASAVSVAVDLAAENICDKIIADFEQFGAKRDAEPQAAAS